MPEEISVIGGASLRLRQGRTDRPHNPPGMGPDHLAGIAETPRVRLERSANTRLQHTGAILRRPRVQAGFMEAEQERLSQLVLAINSQAARKFLFMACENQGYLRQPSWMQCAKESGGLII